MTQQKRLLLAIALSFGLMVVYNFLCNPPVAEDATRLAAADGGARLSDGALDGGPTVAAIVTPPGASELDAGAAPGVARRNRSDSSSGAGARPAVDEARLHLRGRGAHRRDAQGATGAGGADPLHRRRATRSCSAAPSHPPPQMDMAEPLPGGAPQLAHLHHRRDAAAGDPALRGGAGRRRAGWSSSPPSRALRRCTKTFRWSPTATTSEKDPGGYLSSLEVTVKNVASGAAGGELVVHTTRAIDPGDEEAPSMFGGIGNQAVGAVPGGRRREAQAPERRRGRGRGEGPAALRRHRPDSTSSRRFGRKEGAVDGRCVLTAIEARALGRAGDAAHRSSPGRR